MWGALSDEKSGLQIKVFMVITITAFLSSESDRTYEHILFSLFLRLLQPGGLGSCVFPLGRG
jgi:hypothetical protein